MNVDWETCAEGGCAGVQLPGGKCLAHAKEDIRNTALKRFSENGLIDARGVQISAVLLRRILAAAPRDKQHPDRPYLNEARFDRAIFGVEAWFVSVTFGSEARFTGATFGDNAMFINATFGFGADFTNATFGHKARFMGATFGDGAKFDGARFGDWATFAEAVFGSMATFTGATFGSGAGFVRTAFSDLALFIGVSFGSGARFGAATFGDRAHLGPLVVRGSMTLDETVFGHEPTLQISAARLECRAMRLPGGALIELRWADVWLDRVYFGRPAVLSGVDSFPVDDQPLHPLVERSWRTSRPRVMSVRGSDVANLVLANVDLRPCRFSGAHHLDQLRLEGTIDLADPPPGLRTGWALPPLWQWTHRRTLAEEHRWRRSQPKYSGWYPRACRVRGLAKQECRLRPADIALLYRALRKGREDAKDEPGAADFYYGEMEMRRHAARRVSPEWSLLTLYWLVSGYALRAWRALATLALVVVVVAGLWTYGGGFAPSAAPARTTSGLTSTVPTATTTPRGPMTTTRPAPTTTATAPTTTTLTADTSFGGALVYAARTVIGLNRDPQPRLTRWGDILQILLRILGPVLLGLAILSVRGRVKR
jgi:uncharacterized protein YjbI with pentapeptide repeats